MIICPNKLMKGEKAEKCSTLLYGVE